MKNDRVWEMVVSDGPDGLSRERIAVLADTVESAVKALRKHQTKMKSNLTTIIGAHQFAVVKARA